MSRNVRIPKGAFLSALVLVACLYSSISFAEPAISSGELDTYLSGKCFQGVCSPLAGHGSVFVENGLKFDVDPRLVVAIAGQETSFGTNMGCNAEFNAWSWFYKDANNCHDNPLDSWDEGIYWVTRQMWLYFTRDNFTTISQIGAKYCAEGCDSWVPNVTEFYKKELSARDTLVKGNGSV